MQIDRQNIRERWKREKKNMGKIDYYQDNL